MVVQDEDLEIGTLCELLPDPGVVAAPHHPLVQVGFAGVHPDDPDALHVHGPVAGTDQLFEMQVPDVAGVVVPGDRVEGAP